MAFSNSDWIVKLYYAFQDARNVGFEEEFGKYDIRRLDK
jgi:hypothetical protein